MGTVKELLAIARKQTGVAECPPESNNVRYNTWYYGREVTGGAYPWCMVFVQWCFAQAGVHLPRRTASCGELMRAAKAAGCWVVRDFRPGDVVIYDFSGKQKTTQHCGIVEEVLPDWGVRAIEGNTSRSGSQDNGGMVCRKDRRGTYIIGALRPVFDPEKEEEAMDKETFRKMWLELRGELQDNDSGDWSREARDWAVRTGLIQGSDPLPDGSPNYMWEDLLTREQMAVLLFRFAKLFMANRHEQFDSAQPLDAAVAESEMAGLAT